ncbi:MAG TPA: protein kinase [Kofleriaceae bacterium]
MVARRRIQRFELVALLGGGTLGLVYRARDPQLQRDVAIRVIDDDLVAQARAMAQVSHPNLVQVFEVGEDDSGTSFIVMEDVAGRDLATWLAAKLRKPAAVMAVFAQIGRGLAAAHEHGIAHGDFKATNVLVSPDDRPRITDTGLTREPASVASDVRAFCATLRAALGADAMPKRLRAALDHKTPELASVIAALEPRSSRKRPRYVLAASIAALVSGGATATIMLLAGTSDLPCDKGPTWLTAFDLGRVRHYERTHPDAAGIAATLTALQTKLDGQFGDVCTGMRQKSITDEQATMRRACLARRVFAYDDMVDRLVAGAPGTAHRIRVSDGGEPCVETVAPPFTDEERVRSLWVRFARSGELATPATRAQHEKVLAELDRDALAAGELELAALVAIHRAHGESDPQAALSYAKAADDLVKRFRGTDALRAQIAQAYMRAAFLQSDHVTALKHAEQGIAIVENAKLNLPELELDLRVHHVGALTAITERRKDAVAAGEILVARAKLLFGERDTNYATALDALAGAKRATGDFAGAVVLSKRALDLFSATLPPGHSQLVVQHLDYARDLASMGSAEAAREQFAEAAKWIDKNDSVRAQRSSIRRQLASASFETGQTEAALAFAREAVENALADNGLTHLRTVEAYQTLLDIELELDRLGDAERTLAALARVFAADAKRDAVSRAWLTGIEADVANRRGKPRDCERLVRQALATLDELKAEERARGPLHRMLGECLIALRRWQDARVAFETAGLIARKARVRDDQLALIDLGLAQVELGLGNRAAARSRATAARLVLDNHPAQLRAHKLADQIIGDKRR